MLTLLIFSKLSPNGYFQPQIDEKFSTKRRYSDYFPTMQNWGLAFAPFPPLPRRHWLWSYYYYARQNLLYVQTAIHGRRRRGIRGQLPCINESIAVK